MKTKLLLFIGLLACGMTACEKPAEPTINIPKAAADRAKNKEAAHAAKKAEDAPAATPKAPDAAAAPKAPEAPAPAK